MAHAYDLTTAARLLEAEEKEVKKEIRHGGIRILPGTGRDIFISENEIARRNNKKSVSWSIAEIGQLDGPGRLVHQMLDQHEGFSNDPTPMLARLYELSDETNCAGLIVVGDLRRNAGWRENEKPAAEAQRILESLQNAHGVPAGIVDPNWQDNLRKYEIFDFCWVSLLPKGKDNAVAIEYAFTHSDLHLQSGKWKWDALEVQRRDGAYARDYVQIHELDSILGKGVLTTWPLINEDSELETNQFINAINDVEREVWHVDPDNLYLVERSIERIADYSARVDPGAERLCDYFLNLARRAAFDLMAQRERNREVPESAIWRVPDGIKTTFWSPVDGQASLDERLDKLMEIYPHRKNESTPREVKDQLAFAYYMLPAVDEYSGMPNEKIAHAIRHVLDVIAAWYSQRYENETITPWWNAEHRGSVERRSAVVPKIRAWIDEGLPVKEPDSGDNSHKARDWRILNNARQKIANASLILENEEGQLFFTDAREVTVWTSTNV